MKEKTFIFLGGLHRSGTSLLHGIMREHSEISGFVNTDVPEDEGQHLQSVYEPAKTFGGPGKFAFDEMSYMDETHPLATSKMQEKLFNQWSDYFDLKCDYLIEKSPPNIIRTRFLQKLFPRSYFVIILRHPVAVSYATQKWGKISIPSLLEHSLRAYEIFLRDMQFINNLYVLRYEEFVLEPQKVIDEIFNFIGIPSLLNIHDVRKDVNFKYFEMWKKDSKKIIKRLIQRIPSRFERRANKFGYSINYLEELQPVSWLGAHNDAINSDS